MKKMFALFAAAGLTVSSHAALQHTFNSKKVTLDQLPPAAQQAIKTQAGNAPIQDIDMETFDGFTTYQAAFNKGAQHQELRVDAQGRAWGAHWRDIPPNVEQVAERQIGTGKILSFNKRPVNGTAIYHFRYDKSGTPADLFVSQNGTVIKRPAGVDVTESAGAAPAAPQTLDEVFDAAGANATTAGQNVQGQAASSAAIAGGTWMEFKDLPWPVQQTIMNQAGGTSVQRVYKTQRDGQNIYHARFDKNGQRTRLAVGQDGSLLNTTGATGALPAGTGNATTTPLGGATKVSFNDVPQAAKNAITAQANGAAIEDVDKGTVNGQTVYEAAFKKNGKTYELQVKEDGTVLGGHFD
ncbi:MAG: hypothetical protein JWM68_1208 [Verrucomicrobiales bacterium]|nr:hypothetical protein [Verrucomicrobiales bacterium]